MGYQSIRAIGSISSFVALFERGGRLNGAPQTWYRGETRVRRPGSLLPSIARKAGRVAREWEIYQRFRQSAAAFLPHANLAPWDWLLYMRHYGEHTRLLDWTESALAALYFAVEKPDRDGQDGVVWCLDPLRLNRLAGSETLHCAGIDDEVLGAYTIESLKKSSGIATTDYKPIAVIAPRSFPRLIAQQGVFTVTHRQQIPIDAITEPHLLTRIRVRAHAKPSIREGLRTLGITRLTMYPEMQSLSAAGKD